MANLKNDNYRHISLFDLQSEFGNSQSLPSDLICTEIHHSGCYVFENGTAEMTLFYRLDAPTNGATLPTTPNPPGFYVEWEITKTQLLDCISYANIFDVKDSDIEILDDNGKRHYLPLDDDFVRDTINDESRSMVYAYLCLFGADVVEQAYAEYRAEQETKSFKPALEAMLSETAIAA